MRIFLAGATGAIGRRLTPTLVAAGHQVVGMTRTVAKADVVTRMGATPAIADALDRDAVMKVVTDARPDAVVHQLTSLADVRNFKHFDEDFALTNRLRTEGTDYLLNAAREAGARRFIAQSYTGWPYARTGGRVKTEEDPLDPDPPSSMRKTLDAIRELEESVSSAEDLSGIALRYGAFYGPGTSICEGGDTVEMVRKRRLPLFGDGAGVWSFLHIDDAASATQLAIERGPAGIYNIADDEPAEVSVWLPYLAQAIGAEPPRHLPAWIGLPLIGSAGISMMTKMRGASNAKAKRLLGWQPAYASWRDGFRRGLADDRKGAAPVLSQALR